MRRVVGEDDPGFVVEPVDVPFGNAAVVEIGDSESLPILANDPKPSSFALNPLDEGEAIGGEWVALETAVVTLAREQNVDGFGDVERAEVVVVAEERHELDVVNASLGGEGDVAIDRDLVGDGGGVGEDALDEVVVHAGVPEPHRDGYAQFGPDALKHQKEWSMLRADST